MVRLLRAAVVPLVLAGLIALSGVVLGRIYAGPLLTWLVAGAALGSVGAGVAARRLPSWTVAPISVVLLAGYTLLAVRLAADRAALTDPLPALLADALANGIPRLLTAMIPIEATPDTVVAAVVAAWLAGLAGTEIAVRAGRVLLGCAPATALYGGALYVVGPNAGAAVRASTIFAALVVVALATSKTFDRTGTPAVPAATRKLVRGRALAAATAGLTCVVALIGLVGPWLGGRVTAEPVDPRRYVSPPQVDSLDESPLNRISGWALTPREQLLSVRTDAAEPVRMRLAVLSDYDGITWRVGATYRNAGRVLPSPPVLPDAATTTVRQDVTIDGLTGRLLPVVPTPAEVGGARVAYDPDTGTLIRPEALSPGVRYTVTSLRQTPDLNLLPGADSPGGDAVARYLAVGAAAPEPVQRLADQLAEGNGGAFDRALAIEEFLAEHYRKVADAPSGHAFPNLQFFLFGPREQGGQVGTSEQFAASYAVLARLTGLPSRVVVGFDTPAGGGPVTAGAALAWPEVLFDGLGWVPFDPMPRSDTPRPVEEDFTPRPAPPPSQPEAPPDPAPLSASAPPPVLAAEGPGVSPALVGGGAGGSLVLLLALAAVVVILLRRGQTRRRLDTGPPGERVAGAWLEFTDAQRLAGRPVPAHLAATEAAEYAALSAHTDGGIALLRRAAPTPTASAPAAPAPTEATAPTAVPLPPLGSLVDGVNAAAFAPAAVSAEQSAQAGAQVRAYTEALRARRSWWRRLWWSIHPGPLRWHRRRSTTSDGR